MTDEEFMFKVLSHFDNTSEDRKELIAHDYISKTGEGCYFVWKTFNIKTGFYESTMKRGWLIYDNNSNSTSE